jgi:hypothetical protein
MLDWLREHLWWTFTISVVTLVGTVVLVPVVVARMPSDYFVRRAPGAWRRRHPVLGRALWAGRTLLGVVFISAGIAMLVLPGQGILTILIGLMLLEFPGKRELELRLIRRPHVLRAVNWIRARAGRPPLLLPD